jgi:type IV pilus assembly protein PilB
MRVSDALVEDLLKKSGKFSHDQLKDLHEQAEKERKPLQDIVLQANMLTEMELTKLYSQKIDVPFAEFTVDGLQRETLQLITEHVARQYRSVPFDIDADGVVSVAMEDPDDIQAINFLRKQLGKPIRVYIAPSSVIETAIDQYSGSNVSTELAKVIAVESKEAAEEDVAEEDVAEDSPIAQTINLIIGYGIKNRASDVHIEPREDMVLVRYRVDGVLSEANKLPRKVLSALVSRVKILANLKIDERRAPQDGRFKIAINDHIYALRVSTLPIVDGEKIVLRILDESGKAATLEELGFWGESLKSVEQAILQPHGMILITGPTGSGKSTTLFSILSKLNSSSVNISTVEDPVEYRIVGVNQTQVNPVAGMTFASGLRSLLRQDPNIIMVGEIRDRETADLAVQAALTGHLVFSTLHTNDAATSLPRLLDMGVEPFLIASTIRVVIGQRLVRRLCKDCREEYKPDDGVLQRIKTAFRLQDKDAFKRIHELEKDALKAGIGNDDSDKADIQSSAKLSSTPETIEKLWKAHDQGCNNCNQTGYRGRLGIYEILDNTQAIQKAIVNNATSDDLEIQAIKDGMLTMHLDGFIKALCGQTTIEEIMRVTSIDMV